MTVLAAPIQALLADTNDLSREAIRDLCAQSGWNCDCLTEPNRLVEAAAGKRYDVIIAEVPAEKFAAEELLWRLRLANPNQALLVVANDGMPESILARFRDSAVEILPKPISRESLESSVSKVLSATRNRERSRAMNRYLTAESATFEFRTDELARLQPALPIAERLEKSGRIDAPGRKRLELAFQEAMANACDHGNLELESRWKESYSSAGEDQYAMIRAERLSKASFAERKVIVTTQYTEDQLVIRIRNEGPGFVPKSKPAQQGEPLCSGRGLALIYQTMDKVWHEQDGREIVMVKAIAPLHQTKER